MTKEEALEELDTLLIPRDGEQDKLADAFEMAIKALEQEQKMVWFPVNEKLPEFHKDVLLSLRSLDVEVGFRAETEPYFYCHSADGCYIEPQNVLAWMPLPKPYEQEE